jgi:hypothetical protein
MIEADFSFTGGTTIKGGFVARSSQCRPHQPGAKQ